MAKKAQLENVQTPAKQVESFIAEFEPAVGKLIRSCRLILRKMLPGAIEQVYDNYNFLAIGYCTTEQTSDCVVSLACSAKGIALSFYYGSTVPDPDGLLLGSGKQNRFIRLENAAMLKRGSIVSLIDSAVAQSKIRLPLDRKGYTMIKSVSKVKRPRR